jgi:hypothetical protein
LFLKRSKEFKLSSELSLEQDAGLFLKRIVSAGYSEDLDCPDDAQDWKIGAGSNASLEDGAIYERGWC